MRIKVEAYVATPLPEQELSMNIESQRRFLKSLLEGVADRFLGATEDVCPHQSEARKTGYDEQETDSYLMHATQGCPS